MTEPPPCPYCVRRYGGRRHGQVFMRCLPCALTARDQRNAEARAAREGDPR